MREHDEATKQFMEDSGVTPQVRPKDVLKAMQAASSTNPVRGLTRAAIKKGISSILNPADKTAEGAPSPVHAISIFEELSSRYNNDWWEWEPETVAQTITIEFGTDLGPEGLGLVQALQLICKTNQAYENWHVFEKVCRALSGLPVDFSAIQPVEPHDLFHAMRTMDAVRPKQEYEDEIYSYAAACLKNAGVVWVPSKFSKDRVSFIQEKLDALGNDLELKAKVAKAWPKNAEGTDAADLAIQLGRLKEMEEHLSLLE